MKTLKIDTAFLETTKELSDVEFGRLFRGMLKYAFSDADVNLGGNERFFWSGVKADIDKQLKAYSARAANLSKARDNNPNNNSDLLNNNADLLNNKSNLLNNSEQKREESEKEERPKETPQKKSSPPDPLVKENTPEKYPREERGREEKQSARVKSAAEEAFDLFWAVYPKKVGKKDALKAFQKVPSSDYPLLIPAVEQQKQSRQWQSEGGRFIPNPSTWLNQGRWLDEGLDAGFNAPRKNRVAQELDDFYDMAREWAEEQKARAAGDI